MSPLLFLAAVIPALLLLIQVYRADRLEKEPISLLLGLVLCGVIAAELASLTERAGVWLLGRFFLTGSALSASVNPVAALSLVGQNARVYHIVLFFGVVALSEEGFKYLLMRLRTWRSPQFNCSFDGVVYAVFVSLGFALWENILYVYHFGFSTALARAVTAVPGHACFGVFMGTWYGAAKRRDIRKQHTLSLVNRWMAVLIPVLLHGCYDYIAVTQIEKAAWMFLLFVALLFFTSYRMVRRLSQKDSYLF